MNSEQLDVGGAITDIITCLDEWAEAITHALGPRLVTLPSGRVFNLSAVTHTFWSQHISYERDADKRLVRDADGELALTDRTTLVLMFGSTSLVLYQEGDIAGACAALGIEVRTMEEASA